MSEVSKIILTNMCLLEKDDEILVVDRNKSDWPGLTLPGGHVEENETLIESVIREMKEETNLDIKNPTLIDIMEWPWGNGVRYLALLYKSTDFSGELHSSKEGKCFWIKKNELSNSPFSQDFDKILDLYKIKY